MSKLSRCGIPVRRARNAAIIALAAKIPTAVLSPLLGIGLETSVRWTHHANRDWQAYVQARAALTEEGQERERTWAAPSNLTRGVTSVLRSLPRRHGVLRPRRGLPTPFRPI